MMNLRFGGMLFSCVLLFFVLGFRTPPQERYSREAYIAKHINWAQEVHQKFGVPVSVCIAQAFYESEWGNSDLSVKANNHFGMKCKEPGEIGYLKLDDADTAECFRVYPSARESFLDYGKRITTHSIYKSVQVLLHNHVRDPQAWVHEIAKCGYATNPNYELGVMKLIAQFNLTQYDDEGKTASVGIDSLPSANPAHHNAITPNPDLTTQYGDSLSQMQSLRESVVSYLASPPAEEPAAVQVYELEKIPQGTYEVDKFQAHLQVYPTPSFLHRFNMGIMPFTAPIRLR